jgi:hypothetical protein
MTEIAAIIKVFMAPNLKSERPAQATLRPGTMLNGRVAEVLPSGLLQINFGKFRAQTRVKFPVARGDTLRFEVLETGDQIKLKVQDPPPAAGRQGVERYFKPEDLQQFRQLIESTLQRPGTPGMVGQPAGSLRPLMARLTHLLYPLTTDRQPEQLAPLIKALLTNSGLFFEKRLESVLLQIFKTPENVDVSRAVTHPFVTNIFDTDLKPNLLKLAAALSKPASSQDTRLTSMRMSVQALLNQIEVEQAQLGRPAPAVGTGRTIATYPRGDALPGGPSRPNAPGLPAAFLKALQPHLVKSGLWTDPDIRFMVQSALQPRDRAASRYTLPASVPGRLNGTVAGRPVPDGARVATQALQGTLTGLMKGDQLPPSRQLAPLISDFRAFTRGSRLPMDPETAKALARLENLVQKPAAPTAPPARLSESPAERIRQALQTLVRFIERQPLLRRPASAPATDKPGSTELAGRQIAAKTLESGQPPVSADRQAAARTAAATESRSPYRILATIETRAAALQAEIEQVDKALAGLEKEGRTPSAEKRLTRTARSLQSLIGRHQLPVDAAVNRTLAALVSGKQSPGPIPTAASRTGTAAERLLQDLAVLRDFIIQQKAELSETLDLLRTLPNRADADTEAGDRPGPDRGRGADPLQVIAFTLPMEEGQKPARLKVFYPLKRRAGADSGFRISLLLTMERMGPIRADIVSYQKTLEIKFSTEKKAACQHIDGHLNRLEGLLSGPFETVNLTAAVDEKNIAAFEFEDLDIAANRLVDLQA